MEKPLPFNGKLTVFLLNPKKGVNDPNGYLNCKYTA